MLKIFILSFWLSFVYIYSSAQNIITGTIVDQRTNEPIEAANVIANNGRAVVTDVHGNFKIKVARDGGVLNISMIGYYSKSVEIRNRHALIIYLERGPLDLKEIFITPQSGNGSLYNISAIDLNMRPVNSSQDLMRLVPGLFLGQHQGGGIAEHIFFRGFDADHGTDVNVSVDGMPVNLVSHVHGQGFADLHFLIPELVRKYEFGKGPYYTEHGDFTTAGYVNFKTYDVLDKSMIKLEGGRFNTGRVMAMVNLLHDKAGQRAESAYVAGEATYTDGPFDWPQHFKKLNLFGKYSVNINADNRLNIALSTFSSGWRSSGEIPERAVREAITGRFGYIDNAQGGNTNRFSGTVKYNSVFSDKLVLENQAYYSNYFFNLHYNATLFAEDSVNGDELRQRESRSLFGYKGKLVYRNYYANGVSFVSTVGAGAEFNRIRNSELSHTINKNTVLTYVQFGNVKEASLNLYADENLQAGKWLLNFGARLDYFKFNYEDKLNPRHPRWPKVIASPKLNIEYTANPALQVYLKTGKGFHSNDAKAVAAGNGEQILPAAYGADLGINWKPLHHLYINAALWFLKLQQEFVYDADEGTIEPGGKTRRQGMDLSARYQFNKWLFASIDINICRARSLDAPKGSNYLPLAVPVSGTGGLDFKLAGGLNGGLSYRYMKDRPANGDNTLTAQGYFVTDLTANYTRNKYEIGVEIQNLFNAKWKEAQFEVRSRLRNEPEAVDDISFTPGAPFFAKLKIALFF